MPSEKSKRSRKDWIWRPYIRYLYFLKLKIWILKRIMQKSSYVPEKIGVEVNIDKTNYMSISWNQHFWQRIWKMFQNLNAREQQYQTEIRLWWNEQKNKFNKWSLFISYKMVLWYTFQSCMKHLFYMNVKHGHLLWGRM